MNTLYTNGMIAVKEKSLLGEKLYRFAEMSAAEVFRALLESGFGGGAENGELLCEAEERSLDGFIRENAPSRAIAEYFLLPRDYHNAKALVKAKKLQTGDEKLLAPEGFFQIDTLRAAIGGGEFSSLGELGKTAEAALSDETLSGAEVGFLFDSALFARLKKRCKGTLGRLLSGKADRMNILTVLRCGDGETARKFLLPAGTCSAEALLAGDFKERELAEFYRTALAAKERGSFAEAEQKIDSFETEYFSAHRCELEGKEPFLYYVFRRKAEIANVRILLVCLGAGLPEREIKKRLRTVG